MKMNKKISASGALPLPLPLDPGAPPPDSRLGSRFVPPFGKSWVRRWSATKKYEACRRLLDLEFGGATNNFLVGNMFPASLRLFAAQNLSVGDFVYDKIEVMEFGLQASTSQTQSRHMDCLTT